LSSLHRGGKERWVFTATSNPPPEKKGPNGFGAAFIGAWSTGGRHKNIGEMEESWCLLLNAAPNPGAARKTPDKGQYTTKGSQGEKRSEGEFGEKTKCTRGRRSCPGLLAMGGGKILSLVGGGGEYRTRVRKKRKSERFI